jgi:phospholipase/carboxylesterase
VQREDEVRIRASADAVERLIERENARGIGRERIVLAGFSQGGAITLHAGMRSTTPLAGMMPLSTYLPLAGIAETEATAVSRSIPIFMAHGTQDPVVPMARATASRDRLKALGYRVEWHEYPMPHSVNGDEILAIGAFLKRVLA